MQLYDKLLGLPLFLGMSSSDLQEIVTKVKFGFTRYNRNTVIVDETEPCNGLLFILDGEVEMTTSAANHSFTITEYPSTPLAIEPNRLFGLYKHYSHRYVARTQSHGLFVRKDDIMLLASEFIIFRLNLLNIISTQSQRLTRQIWHHVESTTQGRVLNFINSHCSLPSGKKVIHIKMQQLADYTNDARLDISVYLNKLHDENKIILQRGIITIPRLELLNTSFKNSTCK